MLTLLAPVFLAVSPALGLASCDLLSEQTGSCPEANAAIQGGAVDLSAGFGRRSSGTENSRSGQTTAPGENASGSARSLPGEETPPTGPWSDPLPFEVTGFIDTCTPNVVPCRMAMTVQVSDLVTIKPEVPTQGMEPNGWMVVGLPTNFFATASVHMRSGELLGYPAEVRFTPVGYEWNYGDGATGGSTTGGARWETQRLPEFSETDTSHTYATLGRFVITLAVVYAAEYRIFDAAWLPVEGTLVVSATPLNAVAGTASTVLVGHDCLSDPRGPGC